MVSELEKTGVDGLVLVGLDPGESLSWPGGELVGQQAGQHVLS